MNEKDAGLKKIDDTFTALVAALHEVRQTRGDVEGRSVSVAITHVETAHLWYKDAAKDFIE